MILTKIESGPGILAGASNIFSFSGKSFCLSRKILDFIKNKVDENDIKSRIVYDFSETINNYLIGDWKDISDYDEDLVTRNLDIGEIYFASQHLYWHACPKLHQGEFKTAKLMVNKLSELFEVYENEFTKLLEYLLNTSLLMECRNLQEALAQIEQGILFGQKISQGSMLVEMYSCKAHICTLMEDIEEAEKALNIADKVRSEINSVPWQLNDFFRSRFEIDLYRLKDALINEGASEVHKYRLKAKSSAGKLLKVASKVALIRTESYRLMGVYYWLIENQQKSLAWWNRSIEEAERLGAKPELSRTYLEVGERFLEPRSTYKMLNEITANEYLEKARRLFEDMDLQWDLARLDRSAQGVMWQPLQEQWRAAQLKASCAEMEMPPNGR